MKKLNKKVLTILLAVMISAPILKVEAQSQSTIKLGTTSTFAILAGTTITSTGTTIINGSVGGNVDGNVGGDVGLYPGSDFTGQTNTTVSGEIHLADTVAIKAKEDLVTAYNDAAARTPVTRISTELGGTTLTPGTYDSADGTFQITGTLTLDAQGDPNGVFVFKTAATLITASSSNISLINNARFCRTFWKVGSSATLGTNSHFVGHILALTSITAETGATVQGQLLARNGAVTLHSNTITNGFCETATIPNPNPNPAILHVIKHVINDNGGTAVATNFILHVKTSSIDIASSPARGVESPGTIYTLSAGAYTVSEDAFTGYTLSYSGDSDSSGNIILASGDNKTVTITSNDILVPAIVNNSGGVGQVSVGTTPITQQTTTQTATPITKTVTGGQLPKTSTPFYKILLVGTTLTLIGAIGWISRKRYE
ncbi:MAG: DUF3494 domain-containing protein [Clostridiaceae bacterium]|nr:DUF3494 domain-containing protein [Clostridiaceae bacterium]